ncbi:type II toxin-antitoxin system RelE family toxin [Moorella sulfitireducens]|uniref:type II toxin-antitoxin system RelE family toxin n=1 Tax=Neomoorella sulfitireducens TaxID=2972948 RepID=UPI0021ABCEA8|nr:type II toxin-antitoxin system RelE/ParE family toxin [Moorella sulfitireducens]
MIRPPKRIATAIEEISANPISRPNIKPLRGFSQKYRYRIGDMRIIYNVKIEERLIIIEAIGPRGDIYKNKSLFVSFQRDYLPATLLPEEG